MLIDIVATEKWDELNDQVKTFLGVADRLRVRSYRGLGQAVFEISQGTAQFMSHKRAVGFVLGQTSVFESLLPYYYKETYEVESLSHLKLQNVAEWVAQLKKETAFVLYCEDHPVTGELYTFADQLDKMLNEKRIASFRVSHAQHFQQTLEVRPYTVRICSFSPTAAVALCGERFRTPSMMVQNMLWEKSEFLGQLQKGAAFHNTKPELVTQFEADLKNIAGIFFNPASSRIFDRAVCVFEDVSAEAVAEVLFKKIGFTSEQGWQLVATTNLCHWSVGKMFAHWWEPQPTPVQLRGLLIFGTEILNVKDFAKHVISAYEEVKALQSWIV